MEPLTMCVLEIKDKSTGVSLGFITSSFMSMGPKERAKKFFYDTSKSLSTLRKRVLERLEFVLNGPRYGPLQDIAEYIDNKFFEYYAFQELMLVVRDLDSMQNEEIENERMIAYFERHYS